MFVGLGIGREAREGELPEKTNKNRGKNGKTYYFVDFKRNV